MGWPREVCVRFGSPRRGSVFARQAVSCLILLLSAPVLADESQEDPAPQHRVIKTVQPKAYLKRGRLELEPTVGSVVNDPFLKRYVLGLQAGWHLADIFSVEADFGFSPTLGEADWTPITAELIENNHVAPDLSRLTWFAGGGLGFAPIHGKFAVARRIVHYDIFGCFGMGVVRTVDDLDLIGATDDPPAVGTQHQLHLTTRYGGGARIVLGPNVAVRVEARSLVYIETISGTVLEMKNNMLVQGGVSFFLPGRS